MTDEEKKEYEKLKSLLYTGTFIITRYAHYISVLQSLLEKE